MAITGSRLQLGPGSGRLLLRTRRQGVGSRVGHDLMIEVTDWSAQLDLPEDMSRATLTARLGLGSLAVREGSGGVRPLSDQDRQEIEANAGRALGVDRHPDATFESTQVVPDAGGGRISGTLTLHGVPAPVELRVREVAPDRYGGTAVVTQSAHGIKPYSAFLGALKLRDDVEVEVEVDLARAERIESPPG